MFNTLREHGGRRSVGLVDGCWMSAFGYYASLEVVP